MQIERPRYNQLSEECQIYKDAINTIGTKQASPIKMRNMMNTDPNMKCMTMQNFMLKRPKDRSLLANSNKPRRYDPNLLKADKKLLKSFKAGGINIII